MLSMNLLLAMEHATPAAVPSDANLISGQGFDNGFPVDC